MGRLFWKIFLSFWLTLILIVFAVSAGTAIYFQNTDRSEERRRHHEVALEEIGALMHVLNEDTFAAMSMLQVINDHSFHLEIYALDAWGNDLLGRDTEHVKLDSYPGQYGENEDGEGYTFFVVPKHRPPPNPGAMLLRPFKHDRGGILLIWLGTALALSSLVSFLLTWHLTSPIRTLQRAARDLSQGKLETRVSKKIGKRTDEIADLGKDFDIMASRLQSLMSTQRQLLSDISHELRSPLARLQVALGLAQKKAGPEAGQELIRIEHETERLDDLVGQALTLSRLDAGASYPKDDYIDIAEMLKDIIKDCDYEARGQNKQVALHYQHSWTFNANTELLRRALENIIRNAIHYSAENSTVDVTLRGVSAEHEQQIMILVCDQGPGVKEEKLSSLFEPFVRLSASRDRDSGGYGLGLAIAKRAVTFHQGRIRAYNTYPLGLCVEVLLPVQTE